VLKRAAVAAAGAGAASLVLAGRTRAQADNNTIVFLASPGRLLDTRPGLNGSSTPEVETPIAANSEITVQVTDPGGGLGIPAGASGVFGNATVNPQTFGNLIIHPGGTAVPGAATVVFPNFVANNFLANHFWVALSATGTIDVHNQSSGSTHVILDIVGYTVDEGVV
jgi:hypothetical protein